MNWRKKIFYQAIESSNSDGWSTMYSWNGSWMLMRRLEEAGNTLVQVSLAHSPLSQADNIFGDA